VSGRVVALLAFVLAMSFASTAAPAAARGGGNGLDALVLGDARSPVLEALRESAEVDTARPRGLDRVRTRAFDLVVIDADRISAPRLEEQPTIERFLRESRWVIVLDATAADQAAIGAYTALDLGDRQSEMVAFGRSDAAGAEEMTIVDSGDLDPQRAERISDQRREQLRRVAARRAAGAVVEDIEADRPPEPEEPGAARRALGLPSESSSCASIKALCDASALHYTVHVQTPSGVAATPAGYWNQSRLYRKDPSPGSQEASWQTDQYFDVYLDNDGRPQGDNQVVVYRFYGIVNPARTGGFFWMTGKLCRSLFIDCFVPERAWWTGTFGVTARPTTAADSLAIGAFQPTAQVGSTTYSTGEDTTVGIQVAKPDAGGGLSLSRTVSQSQTTSIPSWGWQVTPDSSSRTLSWIFGARGTADGTECDARPGMSRSGCYVPVCSFCTHYGSPRPPSGTSTGAMQINAYGRWEACARSNGTCVSPLRAGDPKLGFELRSPVTLIDSYCYFDSDGEDACGGWNTFTVNQQAQAATLDASVVNPCPDASVTTCDPVDRVEFFNCDTWEKRTGQGEVCAKLGSEIRIGNGESANGFDGDTVVGRITLTRKVANPDGVRVILASDNVSAKLQRGTSEAAGATRAEITIPFDRDSGQFYLLTDAKCREKVTATVRAFFAAPAAAAQLQIGPNC
jgi:hypothetical protein